MRVTAALPALFAFCSVAAVARAQSTTAAPARPAAAAQATAATPPAASDGQPTRVPARDSATRALIARVRTDPNAIPVPVADSFTVGNRVVPADATESGTGAVARGDLDVFGTILGDAVAVGGDVVVHPGGRVRGNALSALGRVRADGGVIDGEMRTMQGPIGPIAGTARAVATSPAAATYLALKISLGWLVLLCFIGIGVLMFAERYLEGVVETVEHTFSRSFWAGVVGQLALLPAFLVLIVALAITLVGILLIPFGVVAFWIAAAGLTTIGFLALAQVTGQALLRGRAREALTDRGATLRALVAGVVVYTGFWVIAAAFTWSPVVGGILRGIAFAVCWVAATTGFGAALLSRAGTRREAPAPAAAGRPSEPPSMDWQTPTPIGGVVAARRPTPAPMKEIR
jgi:hypothetical protein